MLEFYILSMPAEHYKAEISFLRAAHPAGGFLCHRREFPVNRAEGGFSLLLVRAAQVLRQQLVSCLGLRNKECAFGTFLRRARLRKQHFPCTRSCASRRRLFVSQGEISCDTKAGVSRIFSLNPPASDLCTDSSGYPIRSTQNPVKKFICLLFLFSS